jgi:hypothetical protein
MPDVIELPGFCPLCNLPIEPGEQTAVNEDNQTVHGRCWALSQDPGQNNSY